MIPTADGAADGAAKAPEDGTVRATVAIIGGGPAGLAAACGAAEAGCEDALVIERASGPGGILTQCIHDGFGLDLFDESLTGPEWARRFVDRARGLGVRFMTNSMVLELGPDRGMLVSSSGRLFRLEADAVVLAMGCRERTRDAILIPGTRPAGVYTAGLAQNLINLKGYMVGHRALILGSGDVGLIMARRLTLEGARVLACVEILPHPSGLPRNVVQCLEDFDIPLLLSHTVIDIRGKERVEGVTVARVDGDMHPVAGTERNFEVDTLLLSVGLIPENELSRTAGVELHPVTGGAVVDESCMTCVPGIFSCGNVLHVHDLVDSAAVEATAAGAAAAAFATSGGGAGPEVEAAATRLREVAAGEGVRYVVPHRVRSGAEGVELRLRVAAPSRDLRLQVSDGGRVLSSAKVPRAEPSVMLHHILEKVPDGSGPLEVSVVPAGAADESGGER